MNEILLENRKGLETLSGKYSGAIKFGIDLSGKNSICIGGTGFGWYTASDIEELSSIVIFLQEAGIPWKIMGNGSNVLFPDGRTETLFISINSKNFKKVRVEKELVFVGAGKSLGSIISETAGKGLSGFEFLAGIPGTIGGAIKMNASYKKSISDILVKVMVLDKYGRSYWIKKEDLKFSSRNAVIPAEGIILEAVFKLKVAEPMQIKAVFKENLLAKELKQPLWAKTLGCTFMNPENTVLTSGQLIDKTGLKGLVSGGAAISEKHANFIINKGKAKAKDVKELIKIATESVNQKFGISLKTEIEIL